MALILRNAYQCLAFVFQEYRDPRVGHLPAIGTPLPMLVILGVYLGFVLKLGPWWMRNRKPYDLKTVIRIYNVIQVVANLYVMSVGWSSSYFHKDYHWTCLEVDPNNHQPHILRLIAPTYVFYMLKYFDLLDTIFFILRKKTNQVTFLHIYHHAIMVGALYAYITYYYGSHYNMLGGLNSIVHVVMYSYYFASSFTTANSRLVKWKKHITQLQILQFCLLILHFSLPIANNWCKMALSFCVFTLIQNVFMLVMFCDFYYRAYVKTVAPSPMKMKQ